jgi:hypothetical protein
MIHCTSLVVHPIKAKNSMSYKLAAATVMDALIGDDLAVRSTLISQRRRNEARSRGVDYRLYAQSRVVTTPD